MFIVFENNPQLFTIADGLKLFNDVDQAARYALNRGLSNILAPTVEALKAQVNQPGKALTGGQTGFSVTLANIESVDVGPKSPEAVALALELEALKAEKTTLELESKADSDAALVEI